MEFNIALNSIAYLMVFLFPGIIFRRFYFSGDFNREFQLGNLLERFVWSIFFSVVNLLFCLVIYHIVKFKFNLNPLSSISYERIKIIFESLSSNKLPDKNLLKTTYKDFVILISLLYTVSSALGWISFKVITIFNLDRHIGAFTFRNNWYYLIKGKQNSLQKPVSGRNRGMKYLSTIADVLVSDGKENILYAGHVDGYYTNLTNNQLDSILLRDTYKYVLDPQTNKTIKKSIPGNIFSIQNDRIVNINLLYVYEEKNYDSFKKYIPLLDIFFGVLIGLLCLSLWLDNSSVFYPFESTTKKVGFIVTGSLSLLAFKSFLVSMFEPKGIRERLSNFFVIFSFPIFYLWVFDYFGFGLTIFSFIVYIFILSYFFRNLKNSENDENVI